MTGLGELLGIGAKVLDKFIPDPAQRAKAETELLGALATWDAAQAQVNEVEAANPSLFVAGWRPWIGWVCGIAMAYQYVLVPLIIWVAAIKGVEIPKPPKFDDSLWQLMTGMLGVAGLRTYEKIKGVAAR